MSIRLRTPTGIAFDFDIDSGSSEVVITTHNGSSHRYQLRSINDLYNWLKVSKKGNLVYLGTKGEEEVPSPGTVEEWARSASNPVGGFYGTTRGRRGRFASYIPSILEALGLAVVEHKPNNNRVRAI